MRLKICDNHLTCKVANKYLNVRERVEVVEWNKKWSLPFPCCPVSRQCPWKKTLIEKKTSSEVFIQKLQNIIWRFIIEIWFFINEHKTSKNALYLNFRNSEYFQPKLYERNLQFEANEYTGSGKIPIKFGYS